MRGSMRAKTKLKRVRAKRREIELLRARERLLLSPRAIAYAGVRVQTSPQDQMLETVESIQKLSLFIEGELKNLAMDELEAMTMIYSLDNPEYRRVLLLYYIDGEEKSWSEVAELMGYSESRVKHFHGWALAELERKDSTRQHSNLC